MANLTVVAKVVAKMESVEALKRELLKLIAPTRDEAGCIAYRLHQDNADPTIFIFYETWQDRESLTRHMDSAHFKSYIEATGALLADKSVHLLTEIE